MSNLAAGAAVLGVVTAAAGGTLVAAPERVRRWLLAFPRNRWAGRVLAAAALLWSAVLVYGLPLGRFEYLKPLLFVLAPLAIVLVVVFMDELLAARALGGLFLLAPAGLLDAARWHASPLRLVVVVLAYALVVKGLALVLSPHLFRRAAVWCTAGTRRARAWGCAAAAAGALLLVLAWTVY